MTGYPSLTDDTRIHVEGWGEMNDHPDIGLLAERIVYNALDGGRRRAEESAERLAGLLVAFGEHLISAERTRADTLERERDAAIVEAERNKVDREVLDFAIQRAEAAQAVVDAANCMLGAFILAHDSASPASTLKPEAEGLARAVLASRAATPSLGDAT